MIASPHNVPQNLELCVRPHRAAGYVWFGFSTQADGLHLDAVSVFERISERTVERQKNVRGTELVLFCIDEAYPITSHRCSVAFLLRCA